MKKPFVIALSSLSFFVLLGCPSERRPDVVYPIFPDAGEAELEPSGACRAMCSNLAKLSCSEAETPTERTDGGVAIGRSCASTCEAMLSHRRDPRPTCVARAKTPAEVRLCCPRGSNGCTPVTCDGR